MTRFAIKTLGCKVNQYESEKMEKELLLCGMQSSRSLEGLDLVIINTCAVTHIAERKSRQIIRRAQKHSPQAAVYITGCTTVTDRELMNRIPGISGIFTNKRELLDHILTLHRVSPQTSHAQPDIALCSSHTRAYLMIQDGCENFCSYCIIPYTRGGQRSRSYAELKHELVGLDRQEIREIVLTGINLGTYRHQQHSLPDVCELALKTCPNARLRLSSIEPNLISRELIGLMQKEPRFCRHLHIPLQSGCDITLRDMNRKYTTEEYRNLLSTLRAHIPGLLITTDLLVGFPTETEEHFEETCAFVSECGFSKVHVFPYSKRKGTAAADLGTFVRATILDQRVQRILTIEAASREQYLAQAVGTEQEVLPEQEKEGFLTGYTSNYLKTKIPQRPGLAGTIIQVTVTGYEDDSLMGKVTDQ